VVLFCRTCCSKYNGPIKLWFEIYSILASNLCACAVHDASDFHTLLHAWLDRSFSLCNNLLVKLGFIYQTTHPNCPTAWFLCCRLDSTLTFFCHLQRHPDSPPLRDPITMLEISLIRNAKSLGRPETTNIFPLFLSTGAPTLGEHKFM
jgi:hypothetical protein